MRFDKPIYMQNIIQGAYDAETGDYGEDRVKETPLYADVTNAGTDTLQLVYGNIKQHSLVIRLQNHFNEPFSKIRVDDKLYKVDYEHKLRTKHVLVVSEVQ